jgi:hypothetical protein
MTFINCSDRPLVEFARRIQGDSNDPVIFRQRLEQTLEPMVRCALRSGVGQPVLVQFVEDQLSRIDSRARTRPDRISYAAPIARVLCDRLVNRLNPLHGRETVVGL